MTQPAELYACLYAREFPAQALLRLRPKLRNCAFVVMEGEPPLEAVCSLNGKARNLGVERGMTKVEVDTFTAITRLPRSRKEEETTKAALLECAGRFSPRVEDASEDCVFRCVIDIAGTKGLFGPPDALAQSLLARVRAFGIEACIAVSANFHAAVALANGLASGSPPLVVGAGEDAGALSTLPLDVLDLSEEQAETFALWGIRTLGTLAALPERELVSRIGQAGKALRQLARGEMPHFFQPVEPGFALEERMELDSPLESLDALVFVMNLMLEQLIMRASARVLAIASVTVELALEDRTAHERTVRPALPSNDRQLWIKLLHLDLEAHPPQAAILAVALRAEPGSTSKVQLGLFAPQLPEPSRLDVTLARIRAIVGESNAGRAVLKDTHEPDGFRMEPFTILDTQSRVAPSTLPRSAMRRLRPPETAYVTLESDHPALIVFRSRRYVVERAYGPWQSGGEWWNAMHWRREEWDMVAHAQDGTMLCCYLVRDLLCNQWRMEGLYD